MKKLFSRIICILLLCNFSLFLYACSSSADINKRQYMTDSSEMIPKLISSSTNDMSELAEDISPAIVGVSCTVSSSQSLGSGVCIGSGGYILTNQHVIDDGSNIKLYLADGSEASAVLLWEDSSLDIAILKSSVSLPYLSLGDSDDCAVGQDILAVGTPINLQFNHTFTRGIVSALNRTLLVSTSDGDTYMQNMIQHDASLNPGNSGGPLVNKYGEIVGINTLKITDGEGMGFAIPTKGFSSIVQQIYRLGSAYETPYIGVFGYDTSIANYYDKTDLTTGVYVLDVAEDSPGAISGLKEGDVIMEVNGEYIGNMLDLRDILFQSNCYEQVELTVSRDGRNYRCNLVLHPHPVTNIT